MRTWLMNAWSQCVGIMPKASLATLAALLASRAAFPAQERPSRTLVAAFIVRTFASFSRDAGAHCRQPNWLPFRDGTKPCCATGTPTEPARGTP